ncbi:GntR family transcriptional regulator [Oceanirhabdus seepicola]|uniref:GntR family transcriptional regulator n=1 Tax=Oceanirhabdus seepicola TaxID=2828781 RepID=A0A9J6P2Z0_9CLOT|nr:GntR family transcriptional regulator [Oceanirhabdus seepicola]MCM1990983.1 GntR family transcriptional regulator [Oceanirhabdus seepicola]
MLLKINFESDIPIYVQIKNQVIHGIALGTLKPGEILPSVRQLASDIGINMHTVNKSYSLLKSEGYIVVDRRKGATVLPIRTTSDPIFKEEMTEELTTLIASSICKGLNEEEFIELSKNIFKDFSSK